MSAGPADKGLDAFKLLVWDVLVDKATVAIIASIPFATWGAFTFLAGPLSPIISYVVVWITNILYSMFKDVVNLSVIMLSNELHHAAFVSAESALTGTFDKYGMDSPEFRKDRDAHKAALAKFVRNSST